MFGDKSGGPAKCQPRSIERLREQASLTVEKQMATGRVNRVHLGIENATWFRPIQVANIHSPRIDAPVLSPKQEVTAVRKEMRLSVRSLLPLQPRDSNRLPATIRGDLE